MGGRTAREEPSSKKNIREGCRREGGREGAGGKRAQGRGGRAERRKETTYFTIFHSTRTLLLGE